RRSDCSARRSAPPARRSQPTRARAARHCAPPNAAMRHSMKRYCKVHLPNTGPTRGEAEPPPPPGSRRLRARARHLASQVAQAVLRAGARAGAQPRAGCRVRPAAARSQHLGTAFARREDRRGHARHAHARSAPREDGRCAESRGAAAMSVAASVPVMVRLPVWRARFALAALLMAFVVLAGRSLYLQSVHTVFLQGKGEARYSRVLEVPATRGRIVDRNGEALAISTPVKSVWAIPDDVKATPAQMKSLAALMQLDTRELARKLSDADREFVYLKRQIPPETAARVAALGIPGIHQQNEYRRYYP